MESVRIDKWLWAARFYKTRSLAAKAVSGGHIAVNGQKIKPARLTQLGDKISIRQGIFEWVVTVVGLTDRRGSATIARTLYEESEDSIARRDALRLQQKALHAQGAGPNRRPDKHERRKIRQFLKKE